MVVREGASFETMAWIAMVVGLSNFSVEIIGMAKNEIVFSNQLFSNSNKSGHHGSKLLAHPKKSKRRRIESSNVGQSQMTLTKQRYWLRDR